MTASALDHHLGDHWLPYVEGLLSPEETREFEDHLLKCPDCASRLEEMSQWVSLVRDNRAAICPEGWELFQYDRTGEDPLGVITSHLETCSSCAAELESLKGRAEKQEIPRDLWEKVDKLRGEPSPRSRREPWPEWLANLLDTMKDLFRPVVLVPVAVAAIAVFLVVSYPGAPVEPRIVALSSVTWGPESSTLGLMSGQRPASSLPGDRSKEVLAMAILLTNFKHPVEQDRIDSFYRALEPPLSIRDRYSIISPAQLGSIISQDHQRVTYNSTLLAELRSKLGISQMLTLELIRDGQTFSLRASLADATTEKIIREQDARNLTENELISSLETISQSMLHD